MNEQEYLDNRLEDQIKWFNQKSIINKKKYHKCQVILIVLAALVTISGAFKAAEFPWVGYIVPILGGLIATFTGVLGLFKFQENWIQYRTTSESLLQEKFLFLTKSEPYNGANPLQLLVTRVEAIISKENVKWAQYTSTNPPEPAKK